MGANVETFDMSHNDCHFVQKYDRYKAHPQPITRIKANECLARGWPGHLIVHAHRAKSERGAA